MTAARQLWAVVAAGTALRLVLGYATLGSGYDMESFARVSEALLHSPLDVYSARPRWPYPPAFLPCVVLLDQLGQAVGLALHSLIHLPVIAADAAIACVVHRFLSRRGAGQRRALAAAALVALGPSFILISGYHGQFDSVAVLPALLALVLWDEARSDRRALHAGLLIGLAASLKTPMGLMLLALLPTADLRQAVRLVVPAIGVPLLALAPFLVTDARDVVSAVTYNGVVGMGGIGLLVQPGLRMGGGAADPSAASVWLEDVAPFLTLAALGCVAAFLVARRAGPLAAATVLWLTVYVFGVNFAFQYLVWGLPVFLMAGGLAWVAAVQVVAAFPAWLLYAEGPGDGVLVPYAVAMNVLLAAAAVALVAQLRALARGRVESHE